MTPVAAERVAEFVATVGDCITAYTLTRLRLGGYRGTDVDLKSVEGKLASIRGTVHLSLTYRYARRDVTRNLDQEAALHWLKHAAGTEFVSARLESVGFDLILERQGQKVRLTRTEVPDRTLPELAHDRSKPRPIEARGQAWLTALGLTDQDGRVTKAGQGKYRQINRMVEILAPLIPAQPADRPLRIADMGAGKGYLTFALYDYLVERGRLVEVLAIEERSDLVVKGNDTAERSGFDGMMFRQGRIAETEVGPVDMVIALHACDTATDDAIFRGVSAGARVIAVAPCCHKQVRRDMDLAAAATALHPMSRHGIFAERQAEMVTDALRALLVEEQGYKARVFEFVADAHTPKNVLIVAERDGRAQRHARKQIDDLKAMFGLKTHYLEQLLTRPAA